ncbi:asparagine synthase (glutamine-hydrolyzing) [uncultured Roseobacter sp.]|uniref:asparagine synthase (glutamine-hydrolyzing) n=1 Tax=uncultured Roseobacter sp. TaxID=114847 RepID=UPI00261AD50A|nr:asparagine synthase (glutamine-hydrolyzing) [uncultured Roseobacter sp.]
MCGIAGVIGTPRYTTDDVARMIDCITYRGPDDQGAAQIGPALLGYARLAVVDLSDGGQPMSNTDETVWAVFNGEIYNFVELRDDLIARGYRFKSRCDTEVLVHLWREKGVAMLDDLIGMFTFCLWDTRQNKGILARDRQGVKPCYIMELPEGGLAFGSEIKSILSLPGVNPGIDDIGLNLMHNFNYCPPPRTCYTGISHLDPGTYLEILPDGTYTQNRYWSWPMAEPAEPLGHDAFAALLDDAMERQMRFDVEGCLFLSGGVDSSVIAAHLHKHWNSPRMLAFGLDCREEGYGEYHLAEQAAGQFDMIDLHPVQYDHRIVPEDVAKVLHHADQPHGDFSFFLIRKLSEAARQANATVVFNGDGPDEALCGYVHNYHFAAEDPEAGLPIEDYFDSICFMPDASAARVLTPEFRSVLPNPSEVLREKLEPWKDLSALQQIVAWECTALNPGNNLIKSDRMSSAHSIESRPVYFDHRITEALVKLPADSKLRDGVGKHFLKEFGLRYFSRDLMFRRKSMPTMPIGEWIKGPLEDWARDTLNTLDPARYNVPAVQAMLSAHKAGAANHTRELRTMLMAAAWMQNTAAAA